MPHKRLDLKELVWGKGGVMQIMFCYIKNCQSSVSKHFNSFIIGEVSVKKKINGFSRIG